MIKLSKSQYASITIKKNKYGAVKIGDSDSKKEHRRLMELNMLLSAGKITSLIPHVTYTLIKKQITSSGKVERAIKYTCDAQYIEDGKLIIEDTKSEATRKRRDYIMVRKLMLDKYGIEIREV